MAYLGQVYDTAAMPESTNSFEPIPAGWYSATITEAELRDTRSGSGQYLRIRYDITGPEYQGRVVFSNLNLRNSNPKAEEIAMRQFGELMRSAGFNKVQDSDELIGAHIQIKVKIRPASGEYEASNEVAGFKPVEGSAMPAPAAPAAPSPAPAKASPPWAKR